MDEVSGAVLHSLDLLHRVDGAIENWQSIQRTSRGHKVVDHAKSAQNGKHLAMFNGHDSGRDALRFFALTWKGRKGVEDKVADVMRVSHLLVILQVQWFSKGHYPVHVIIVIRARDLSDIH
jgi:hypothetical protein